MRGTLRTRKKGAPLGGLDGGDVWVDEDGVDAFLLERLDGLRARVVKLTRLADREAARAQDEDLARRDARRLLDRLGDGAARQDDGARELAGLARAYDGVDKDVKEELCVARAGRRLGVELDREERELGVPDAFVRAVVGVDKELLPGALERRGVDGIAVVLARDVAPARDERRARQVGAAVAVLELERLRATRTREQLVTETDAKHGKLFERHRLRDPVARGGHDGWVAGTVGEEEAVERLFARGEVVVVPRDDLDLYAALEEAAELVELHADVDAEHSRRAAVEHDGLDVLVGPEHVRRVARDTRDEVLAVRVVVLELLVRVTPAGRGRHGGGTSVASESAGHATELADLLGERARVDAKDGGHALVLEPLRELGLGVEVGKVVLLARVVGDDQAGDVDL